MRRLMLIFVFVTGFFNTSFASVSGLVGIQYGSQDFSNAERLVVLNTLDNTWGEAEQYGRQWSGRWQGFLVGPATATVNITIETNQTARIEVAGRAVTGAGITMIKGRKYPVTVSYIKTGDQYDCFLRIKWSWPGQEPVAIGGSDLVYAEDVETKLSGIVAAGEDDDDDDDDEGNVVSVDAVSSRPDAVPGTTGLPLQYLGPELPDGEAPDGHLRYSPGVQNIQISRANRKYPPPLPPEEENKKGWTYQHHVGIGCWKGKLYGVWDMSHEGEDNPPCHLVYSTSSDGFHWSQPKDLYPFNEAYNLRFYFYHSSNNRMLVFACGWYPTDNISESKKDRLYVREITAEHKLGKIYTLIKPAPGHPPFYTESKDAGFLQACREAYNNEMLLEQGDYGLLLGDRKMKWHDGKNWPGGQVPSIGGDLWRFGKSLCFYPRKIDDAWIGLCKMGFVTQSDDGGETWSLPVIPRGIKGGGGKLWAQRTPDSRYAMIYIPQGDHRYPMAITSSDDGITFRDMRVIHGEVAPQRYEGRAKDIGPQYLRGISEWGSDDSCQDKDCIWTIYSVNKEDIWASRIPVPVLAEAKEHVDDKFDDFEPGFRVPGWNTYSPSWAPVRIEVEPGGKNHYLELQDREPTDYARAIRTFPVSRSVDASFRVAAGQAERGRLEIELLGKENARPVRLILSEHGQIRAVDGSQPVTESFSPGLSGTYFNSDDFQRPDDGVDLLRSLDHDWGDSRGSDWSARWSGIIECPYSGPVSLSAEATDGLRLKIGDKIVIDGLPNYGPRSGKIIMNKGDRMPITLEFTSAQGKAKLALSWSWPGQSPTIVPPSALSHKDAPKIKAVDLMAYKADEWLDFDIHTDCKAGRFTVKLNGKEVLKDAKFAESTPMVYALSFRTGEYRGRPTGRADEDIPNTEEPLEKVTYRIDDVMTGNLKEKAGFKSDCSNCTLVGGCFDGPCRALFIVDTLAYIGNGGYLEILSIKDPSKPVSLGKIRIPQIARDIYVDKKIAYVVNEDKGLQIIDVSEPASPSSIGSYALRGDASCVYVKDNLAYVGAGENGLRIIDVSDPASAREIGFYNTGVDAERIYAGNDLIHVADGGDGLFIIKLNGKAAIAKK